MSILDKDLVRSINSGRAFLLVGSGASSAAGVADWRSLAVRASEIAYDSDDSAQLRADLEALLAVGKYPDVFEKAAAVVGADTLCAALAERLQDPPNGLGPIYPLIARWPIPTYMTTNFDDLLPRALVDTGEAYIVRGNSHDEMRTLRADTAGVVFKLHGSLNDPANAVLTTSQYEAFSNGLERKYWRDILFAMLRSVDVVILGYSVSDPNFREQLAWAKENAAPNRPIFMITTGFDQSEVDSLFEEYNIRAIQYENADGDHRDLGRLLHRYDPFIARRKSAEVGLPPVDEDQARLAGSLYVFTRLRLGEDQDSCLERTYCALLLSVLGAPPPRSVSLVELAELVAGAAKSSIDPSVLNRAVERLYAAGYIAWDPDAAQVELLLRGEEAIANVKAERNAVEDRFDLSCSLYLKDLGVDGEEAQRVISVLKRGIVASFERRGLEIANAVVSDATVKVSDAGDILAVVNDYGAQLSSLRERAAFADLTIRVLLEPGAEMKNYLAGVAQGYFAYHALGWEPQAAEERLGLARDTTWIVDSSIILSRLAVDCSNHRYADDLMAKMAELGIRCVTTERLFEEIEGHARWAISEYVNEGLDSLELLKAVVLSPGHRQNLFVDGFAHWAEGQAAPSLGQYMRECLGTSKLEELSSCIRERLSSLGVDILAFEAWDCVSGHPEAYAERDELCAAIREQRTKRGTFKNEDQCVAEAEVLVVARHENVSFLTLSNVLKGLAGIDRRVNWQPEALYRFLSLLSTGAQDEEMLFESMTQTFYTCGFDIVDRESVSRFAGGLAHQARLQLDQEREKFAQALSDKDFGELADDFDRTPDEQKPFYALQFAHYVAARAAEKAEAAEKRAVAAEAKGRLSDKERAEFARLQAAEKERQRKAKKTARRHASKPKKRRKR